MHCCPPIGDSKRASPSRLHSAQRAFERQPSSAAGVRHGLPDKREMAACLLKLAQPARDLEGLRGKFKAFYRMCSAPNRSLSAVLEEIGYTIIQHTGYIGHDYYARFKPAAMPERQLRSDPQVRDPADKRLFACAGEKRSGRMRDNFDAMMIPSGGLRTSARGNTPPFGYLQGHIGLPCRARRRNITTAWRITLAVFRH